MVAIPKRSGWAARLLMAVIILPLAFGTSLYAQGHRYKSGSQWAFGVMGDTQWFSANDPTGENKEFVSAAIAKAIQAKLIEKDVRFVIQTGDLTDRAGDAGMASRAEAAQPLYDAGIGFFPVRGNHEEYGYLYGRDPEWNLNIPAFKSNFQQTQGLANTFGATNFSSPDVDILKGLSYSFDYANPVSSARFVMVDVEGTSWNITPAPVDPVYGQGYFYLFWTVFKATGTVPSGMPAGTWFRVSTSSTPPKPSTNFYGYEKTYPLESNTYAAKYAYEGTEYWPGMQQEWVSARLDKATRGTEHAFVFSHRPMMGAEHVDGFFGANPGVDTDVQNAFYASLMNNDVRYMISGHDHIHNHARLESPDGSSHVEQMINIGASTKFYEPASLDEFSGQKGRETQIAQETQNVGYYVYTVDGPRVTVEYYSDAVGNWPDGDSWPDGDPDAVPPVAGSLTNPAFNFVKKETWGYSHNGRQYLCPQGVSYTECTYDGKDVSVTEPGVKDVFNGTQASILFGTNASTTTDRTPYKEDAGKVVSAPRPLVKSVNTGWVAKDGNPMLASNIFSLWGMTEIGKSSSDEYVLQMSYVAQNPSGLPAAKSGYRLATVDANGKWVRAVDKNIGNSIKTLVRGPWKSGYPLGTQGIDEASGTLWAVVNYDADFAAYNFQLGTTTSAFVYNRTTKRFSGKLTLTNTSEETINQVSICLTGLSPNVTLIGASKAADGSPYISKTFATGLKPGASVAIPLSFTVAGSAKINFIPMTYAN